MEINRALARPQGALPAEAAQARLREACAEFEGLLLARLLAQMQAAAPQDGVLRMGAGRRLFTSLWAQELGRVAARRGPLGIADLLYETLSSEATNGPRLKPQAAVTDDRGRAASGPGLTALGRRGPGGGWVP